MSAEQESLARRAEVHDMRREGATVYQIARKLRITERSVYRHLAKPAPTACRCCGHLT